MSYAAFVCTCIHVQLFTNQYLSTIPYPQIMFIIIIFGIKFQL